VVDAGHKALRLPIARPRLMIGTALAQFLLFKTPHRRWPSCDSAVAAAAVFNVPCTRGLGKYARARVAVF
jgi:hypothetical protein